MNDSIRQYLERHGFGHFSPKAVLFDMDGVLYDSMPHHAIAWQESMKRFGIDMTEADAYATEGARGIDTIRQIATRQGKEVSLEEAQCMYDEKSRIFHEMPDAPIFDGVFDMMEKIKRAGMTVNVVTGSGQRSLIRRLLNDFGRYLDENHITTAYDVKRGKPYPDPYLMGLQKAGNLKSFEGIVVENAPLGVRSGVSAGIFTVAINSGPLPNKALLDEGADVLYDKMTQFRNEWDNFI